MVVLFTRECIVLPKCNELYVSLLYFGAFVQAQVKAFALHTSGNSARYFHQPVTSYHSFVLYSISLLRLFKQKTKNMKPYATPTEEFMNTESYHTGM